MRSAFFTAILSAALAGCAAVGPLNEIERARFRTVVPVRAQFVPVVEFRLPPGKGEGAKSGALGGALGAAQACAYTGPFFFACMAVVGTTAAAAGAVAGAAITPSNEDAEALVIRARAAFGDVDVQHLIVKKFAEGAARFTQYDVVPATVAGGPRSARDRPTYAGAGFADGTVVAEVYVEIVGATLADITGISLTEYADRRPRIGLVARMRLVRPADGTTLMERRYRVLRFGRRIGDYEKDWTLLVKALAGAVDEAAIQMVDDAFLLADADATTKVSNAPKGASRSTVDSSALGVRGHQSGWEDRSGENPFHETRVTPLEPVPSGTCFVHTRFDCWALNKVPQLDTRSPRFRWAPFQNDARKLVYDLWVFGAEENRMVEGLKATEYRFDAPFPDCARFSWAVRARFDTRRGPRAVEWSSVSAFSRGDWEGGGTDRPTFGAPFITPCSGGES